MGEGVDGAEEDKLIFPLGIAGEDPELFVAEQGAGLRNRRQSCRRRHDFADFISPRDQAVGQRVLADGAIEFLGRLDCSSDYRQPDWSLLVVIQYLFWKIKFR